MGANGPTTKYRQDYTPPAYLIDTVDLRVELGEDKSRVRSRLVVRRNPDSAETGDRIVLDGRELELVSIGLDGNRLDESVYTLGDESLTVSGVGESFTLETVVDIKPHQNTSLEGLYQSSGNFCTQCEPEGFRKITYSLDRPDVMARYTTTIEADRDRYPVLLSNGNRIGAGELDGGRHWVRWEDPFPKPSYLFALVAGDLIHKKETFTTRSGREVAVRVFVQPQNADKCDHALRSIRQSMKWDEEVFGREYDLDVFMVVAVDDFNVGAMENKGLNIFNSKYVLASPDTATDEDYEDITSVIGHEYFHNWSGDRVTCRDWFQLSLKEGFTVLRDQLFTAEMTSPAIKRIKDVNLLRTHQFREDAGPLAHPVRPEKYQEINNFYTLTVYNKGAEVVRMLRTLLGVKGFRQGTDLYFERHDGQAVTVEDFVKAMEDANGADFTQFRRWYSQAGTPRLEIESRYDGASKEYSIKVEQSCPATPGQSRKEPFHIPFGMGLLDRDGNEIPLRLRGEESPAPTTRVLELRQPLEEFTFVDVPSEPVLSALRGFSAPVKVDLETSDRDLAFLMANDVDDFNRWDAFQRLANRIIMRLMRDEGKIDEVFLQAFGRNLANRKLDRRLLVQTLVLPSEAYLAGQVDEVDPAAIHRARRLVIATLARRFKQGFLSIYQHNRIEGPYAIDAESIGQRKLKNTCLGYLTETGDEDAVTLCVNQYHQADNMTDVLAALGCLANHPGPERDEALDVFYARWREEPLVVDKWLAVQATSRLDDTFEKVNQLMRHPAFNIENPNKVRALIGAFCGANQAAFHHLSGQGYAFLAENVLRIDALNPSVAARLLTPLSNWRSYEPVRRGLMKTQLERISSADTSRNLREIVSNSLA